MTSPASAQFPWSDVPEPPSGEFRSGRLPLETGGDYIAARGARPGPALLISVDRQSGYAAIHGVFRLAAVLDARRLAGSLLIGIGSSGTENLVEPTDSRVSFAPLLPGWQELATAGYTLTGDSGVDRQAIRIAANSGARYRYGITGSSGLHSQMASLNKPSISLRIPGDVDSRLDAVETVFQGLINVLRLAGMLEGQLAPVESTELQAPSFATAPVAGYWSPAARPGQRIRINDKLGSFRDARGNELGDLLANISGTLLGTSTAVWIDADQPLAELARPLR